MSTESRGAQPPWDPLIPIISLWMPWANWVMLGWKTVETRRHAKLATLAGRTIGIHATNKWDDTALYAARPYLTDAQFARSKDFLRIGSAILGTVRVVWSSKTPLGIEFSPQALIECATKRYGLGLRDPKIIEAIPAKGKQGIWYYRG
jgi:hypothetical protein